MEIKSGIYMIKNKVTDKVYIGQAKDIENRWKEHVRSLNKNKHHSKKLQRAWNKNGCDNFEFKVVENVQVDELNATELYHIDLNNSVENGYNMIRDVSEFYKVGLETKATKAKKANDAKKSSLEFYKKLEQFPNVILKNLQYSSNYIIPITKVSKIDALLEHILNEICSDHEYHIYVGGKYKHLPMCIDILSGKKYIGKDIIFEKSLK